MGDNIEMDLEEKRCEDVDRIKLAHSRFQWQALCEHANEPSGFLKDLELLGQLSDCHLLKVASVPYS